MRLSMASLAAALALAALTGCANHSDTSAANGKSTLQFPGTRPTPEQMKQYMSMPPPSKSGPPTPNHQ